jgi:hypothetical protein
MSEPVTVPHHCRHRYRIDVHRKLYVFRCRCGAEQGEPVPFRWVPWAQDWTRAALEVPLVCFLLAIPLALAAAYVLGWVLA